MPPIQTVMGARFPGVKQLGREADQAPLSSTKVKDLYLYSPFMPSNHVEG